MWTILTVLSYLFLALLHLMPTLAAVRPQLLTSLYGVQPGDPAFVLLQHRAALFGAILALCLWAAFDEGARPTASVAAAISMLSFLWIYAAEGQPPALRTIALADISGLTPLALALFAAFRPQAAP